MCKNKPEHKWPRGFDSKLTTTYGSREIHTCNDCLAIKIVFYIFQKDGSYKEETHIVEPS